MPNKSVAARLGDRLPDAGAVFDDLLARGTFAPCPCGANALIVFTALPATHEFFRTDEGRGEDGDGVERPWVNANSSFLDLQSLYGSNAARTRALRDGARLRDGVLGDENRLAALPTVAAILGLFRAEHNAIVDALRRNDPAAFADDDACFEQARAIVLAVFILVVLYEYVGGINGSPRWSLERFLLNARPYAEDPVPMHGSVEFKLLYQFHASIPERWAPRDATDGAEALLRDAIATPAGAFGARNTPRFLRAAEVKAIEWGRRVGACSYNDLREKIGLPRRTAWAQLSSDPDVRAALERHYPGGVDDLELYVGVTVEEYDAQLVSHRGWSIPQTLYYAIRNDAVSSGLGDRFHTRGLDAAHLTEWGYDRALTSGRLAVLVNRHTKLDLPPHADIFRAPARGDGGARGRRRREGRPGGGLKGTTRSRTNNLGAHARPPPGDLERDGARGPAGRFAGERGREERVEFADIPQREVRVGVVLAPDAEDRHERVAVRAEEDAAPGREYEDGLAVGADEARRHLGDVARRRIHYVDPGGPRPLAERERRRRRDAVPFSRRVEGDLGDAGREGDDDAKVSVAAREIGADRRAVVVGDDDAQGEDGPGRRRRPERKGRELLLDEGAGLGVAAVVLERREAVTARVDASVRERLC